MCQKAVLVDFGWSMFGHAWICISSRLAGYHAPGLLSLRRGALAHHRLARGSSSVQFARHVRVCMLSLPTVLPIQERQFQNLQRLSNCRLGHISTALQSIGQTSLQKDLGQCFPRLPPSRGKAASTGSNPPVKPHVPFIPKCRHIKN